MIRFYPNKAFKLVLLLVSGCFSGILAAQTITFEDGDHISIVGNSLAERMQHDGWLETLLQSKYQDHQLVFTPYVNSFRRLLSYWASPINLEWAVDNRTVGLRVPDSDPDARRVENRLAGADVNPYLAIAATLACGYLGMIEGVKARAPIEGTAYDLPFSLHREMHSSIAAMKNSEAMRSTLGSEFVDLYCLVKQDECRVFEEIVTPWEREILMLNV